MELSFIYFAPYTGAQEILFGGGGGAGGLSWYFLQSWESIRMELNLV